MQETMLNKMPVITVNVRWDKPIFLWTDAYGIRSVLIIYITGQDVRSIS